MIVHVWFVASVALTLSVLCARFEWTPSRWWTAVGTTWALFFVGLYLWIAG